MADIVWASLAAGNQPLSLFDQHMVQIDGLAGVGGGAKVGLNRPGAGTYTRLLQAKMNEFLFVSDFFTLGTSDDAASFQAVLNYAATLVPSPNSTYTYGSVTVYYPMGIWNISKITIPTGVILACYGGIGVLAATTTGMVIDTNVYNSGNTPHVNGGLLNTFIIGMGAGTPLIGVRINNAQNFLMQQVRVTNTADQGILVQSKFDGSGFTGTSTSNTVFWIDVRVFNCVLATTHSVKTGGFEIMGSDHEFFACECFSSKTRTLSNASKFNVAWNLRGVNEARWVHCKGSLMDQGLFGDTNCSNNFFTGLRLDADFAESLFYQGSSSIFDNIDVNTNALAADNTYDVVTFDSNSQANIIVSGLVFNAAGNANWPRYAIADQNTVATRPNRYNMQAINAYNQRTGLFNLSANSSAAINLGDNYPLLFAVNSATPSVTGSTEFFTNSSSPTTYTNFTGGYPGQTIKITGNDPNTSIQNSANISLFTAGSFTFSAHNQLWLKLDPTGSGVWHQVGGPTFTGSWAISSGFGTGPTITTTSAISFSVVVGTTPGSSGILNAPGLAVPNGWSVQVNNVTSAGTLRAACSAKSTTQVTITSYATSNGAVTAFNPGDVLEFIAAPN